MTRKRTIVKWLDRLKGFGFVEPDDGNVETFVHYTVVQGTRYRNLCGDENGVPYDEADQRESTRPFKTS